MNYEKLKKTISDKGVTLNDLCNHIELTESGFHAAVKNNSLKIKTIEAIADYLNLPVSYFFDDNSNILDKEPIKKIQKSTKDDSALVEELKATNEFLKEELQYFKDLVKNELRELKSGKCNGVEGSQQKDNTISFRPVRKAEQLSLGFGN